MCFMYSYPALLLKLKKKEKRKNSVLESIVYCAVDPCNRISSNCKFFPRGLIFLTFQDFHVCFGGEWGFSFDLVLNHQALSPHVTVTSNYRF